VFPSMISSRGTDIAFQYMVMSAKDHVATMAANQIAA